VSGTDKGPAAKCKGEDTAATATFFSYQLHLLTDVNLDTDTTIKPMSKHKNACYVKGKPI
jgi:hypothetical protein